MRRPKTYERPYLPRAASFKLRLSGSELALLYAVADSLQTTAADALRKLVSEKHATLSTVPGAIDREISDPLLTCKDVARLLRCSHSGAYLAIKALPHERVGCRGIRIRTSVLAAWRESQVLAGRKRRR